MSYPRKAINKYLGLISDYLLVFNKTAKVLEDSGGRALGAVINKYISNWGLVYFVKLMNENSSPLMYKYIYEFGEFVHVNVMKSHKVIVSPVRLGMHLHALT